MAGKQNGKAAAASGTKASSARRSSSGSSGSSTGFSFFGVFSSSLVLLSIFLAVLLSTGSPAQPRGALWTSVEYALPRPMFQLLTSTLLQSLDYLRSFPALVSILPPAPLTVTRQEYPPYYSMSSIWTEGELQQLGAMVRDIKSFPSVVRDQTSLHEHIGEGTPRNADGTCPHPYLIPNIDGKLCVLATRVDVGVHYLMSGGPNGVKESRDHLIARTLGFSKFFISNPLSAEQQRTGQVSSSALDLPALKALFQSKAYLEKAASVCHGLTTLDPFQLGVILQLPGQQLGVHLDVPWFFGASRFHYPQWLLVVMRESGLWEDRVVRQVQGVAYLHEWNKVDDNESLQAFTERNGGEFTYWPSKNTTRSEKHPPVKNSAIILDGSIIPHGTAMFRPAQWASLPVEKMRRNSTSSLEYTSKADNAARSDALRNKVSWRLKVDGEFVKEYQEEDVRISLVWRAMCFASESERARYHSHDPKVNPTIELDEILEKLSKDLVKRGHTVPETPLDLAVKLLSVYVDYPWPEKLLPFNYCIVPGAAGDAVRRVLC